MNNNFEKILKQRSLTLTDVSKATGIAPSTLSEWKSGKHEPSIAKIQKIADYLEVSVEMLMTGKDTEKESVDGKSYYFDSHTAEVAQELFETPGLRMLFDAARDSKPEDLQMAADLLKRLKGSNPNG